MLATVKFNGKTYPVYCYGKSMDEYISAFIHSGVFYEEPLLKYILNNYPSIKTVIDVGANIGNHSAFFSKVMGADVIAFEPVPDNYRFLIKNNSEGENYHIGLSDVRRKMGYFTNFLTDGKPNMGGCTLTDGDTVEVDTLDSFNLKPDLIKIDVEGMEPSVIQGGLKTIEKYKPLLVIEHNDIQNLYETARMLVPLGYKITPFVEKNWEIFIYEKT